MGRVYLHLGYIHHFSLVTLCRLQSFSLFKQVFKTGRFYWSGNLFFFAFAPRTVFLLCFSFIVCGVLPTGVLWLHIPHTLTLRYVTFVCNNTLDILPDVRYRVFLVYIVSLSQHHMDERLREWWFGQYVERFRGMSFYYLHSREQHVCMFCCRVQGQYQPRTGSMAYNAQALYSSYRPSAHTVPIQCISAHCT